MRLEDPYDIRSLLCNKGLLYIKGRAKERTAMTMQAFPDSAVHDALMTTGLIANYRLLEGQLALAHYRAPIPDLAPVGVVGGCSTKLAIVALEIAAMGSQIDGGVLRHPDAVAALRRIAEGAAGILEHASTALSSGG
jgi:hypothetical protein